ncbi:MAG: outer membrane protein [Rhodothalassiaceae bacterium]
MSRAAEPVAAPAEAFAGLSLGLGGGSHDVTFRVGEGAGRRKVDGSDGEVWFFANYNYALDDNWLIGLDGEASILGDSSTDPDLPPGVLNGFLFNVAGSVTLRGGYAWTPRLLGYVRLGWAIEDFGEDGRFNGVQFGGGVEWRLIGRVALRAEVAHDFLPTRRLGPSRMRVSPRMTTVRAGLLWRF